MNLQTGRTNITPIAKDDIPEVLEMYLEPDSFKYIRPHKDKTKEYYHEFLKGKIETNKRILGFWIVRLKETNEFIGTVNLNQFQGTDMTHVGCHLKRSVWNRGYATELMHALMKHGFEERELSAIHGVVEESNLVSAKLMKGIGFIAFEERMDGDVKLIIYRKYKA